MPSKQPQKPKQPQQKAQHQKQPTAAIRHAGGRPRTTTPEKEDLIALGEELLAWATEEIPDSEKPYRFRFAQWYSLKKGILSKEWDLMLQKEEFRVYYEQAQTALANRITDTTLREGIAHRFLRVYAPEVKREENEQEQFKSELKKQENQTFAPEDLERMKKFMDSISQFQK